MMKERVITVALDEVVLDFDLYPRQRVDSQHVSEMLEAANAGTDLPPIVLDKKSRRCVDGFHRHRVQQRRGETRIAAIEREYLSDAEMFLDAMRLNAHHGRALTSYDRTHSVLLAGKLGLSDEMVAGALQMTVKRLEGLRLQRSASAGNGKLGTRVAIKRTIGHMAGRKLNKDQRAANKKLSGMNQGFYVDQIITLIEADLLNKEDEDLIKALRKLHGLLDTVLAAV